MVAAATVLKVPLADDTDQSASRWGKASCGHARG